MTTTTTKEIPLPDPEADQQAAARERSARLRAFHEGQEVTARSHTVEVTPDEAEALARGEIPAAVQAQIDRQTAEDAAIAAMETEL